MLPIAPASTSDTQAHRHDAEERQEELSDHLDAEGHTRILRKIEIEPRRNLDALVELQIRLDPNLQGLVKNKEQHNNAYCSPTFRFTHPNVRLRF